MLNMVESRFLEPLPQGKRKLVREIEGGIQWLLLQLSAVLTCERGLWVIFHCIDP